MKVLSSFVIVVASNIKVEASLISWPGDIYDNDRTMPMHCMSDDEVIDSATFPTEKLPYFFYAHPTGITTNGMPVHLGNSPRFPLHSFYNMTPTSPSTLIMIIRRTSNRTSSRTLTTLRSPQWSIPNTILSMETI